MTAIYYFFIDVLDWFELHPGLAVWLQALGVMVALGIAIWVPYRTAKAQRERDAADRQIQAQGLAVAIHAALATLDQAMEKAVDTAHGLEELIVDPPRTILENIHNLWRMGPAGSLVLRVLGGLEDHRVQVASRLLLTLSKDEQNRFFGMSRDRLKGLRNQLFEAREQVRLLFQPAKEPSS